ncbi:SIR2 family protein [candidate division WOR-3 bacterium]|nr:SIR2 family protein [candidate division WOR-3 bacterium]
MDNNLLDKKASNDYFCSILEIIKNVGLTDLSPGFGLLLTKLKASDKGEYAIFLGAGASLGSGGKSGDQIALKFAKELRGKTDIDINNPKDAKLLKNWFKTTFRVELSYTSAMEAIGTKPEMKDVMAKELKGMKLSIGYKSLAKLITENYFQIIFTTNFDQMIEDALSDNGLKERKDFSVNIVGVHEVEAIREKLDSHSPRIKIVKLHGDIGYALRMKCTREETEKLPEGIKNIFEEFLKKKGFIFVGYRGWDTGILGILENRTRGGWQILRRKQAPAERSVWWVSPRGLSAEHEDIDIIQSFLRRRGSQDNVIQNAKKDSQVIPLGDFDTFFVILSEKLLGGCIQPIKLSSDEILTEISNAIKTKNYSYLYRYIEFLESEEGNELFTEAEFTQRVFEIFKKLIEEFEEFELGLLFNVLSLLDNSWDNLQKYFDKLPRHKAINKTGKILEAATYALKNMGSMDDKEKFMNIFILVSKLLRFCNDKASAGNGSRNNLQWSLEYCDGSFKDILNLAKDGIINSEKCTAIEEYKNSKFRKFLELIQYIILLPIIPQFVFFYEDKEQAFKGTAGIFSELQEVLNSVRAQYSINNTFSEGKSIAMDVISQINSLQRNISGIQKLILYKWGGDLHG